MKNHKITKNWVFKLASVIIAAVLWFLITNINDPVIPIKFDNVPVTFKNTDIITDAGQVYQVLDGTDTIGSVTIYAPRSIADTFTASNIIATADFENLTFLGDEYIVPISLSTNKYYNQIQSISGSIEDVALDIENKATKTLRLSGTTTGTVEDGYMVSDVTVAQNQIRISGPESVVDTIASAGVKVEVTGYTSNIGTNAEIILYDEDGNEVDDSLITKNIDSVSVSVTILATKYVSLNFITEGIPADGYMVTGSVESTPDTILLAGKSSVLSTIDSITIDDDTLDVSELTEDLTTTIDLKNYLPTGTQFGDTDFNGVVSVVVHIAAAVESTVEIPATNVEITNVPDGYTAALTSDDNISITVRGLQETIDTLDANDITGVVDINGIIETLGDESSLEAGTYETNLTLTLPGGITVTDTVKVEVELTKEED